ncbi:hypothetical protein BDZ45DRAFT_754782 [Acephala macrosclerotiorum]|nr:hypothetical protein BDZ45DRAFT_754782 [Acephala macrosclerotiorum]
MRAVPVHTPALPFATASLQALARTHSSYQSPVSLGFTEKSACAQSNPALKASTHVVVSTGLRELTEILLVTN